MNIVKSAQIFAESLIIFLFFGSIRNQDQIQEFSINVQPIGNASDSLFGFSVAWGTSDLVVGEPYASNLTGMIYIVNVTNGTIATLFGEQPRCQWGYAVSSLRDTLVAVGAPSCNNGNGIVSVYKNTNGTWNQSSIFYGHQNESLGRVVVFGGNTTTQYLASAGYFTVHIYSQNGSGDFVHTFALNLTDSIQCLAFSDPTLPEVDLFIGTPSANSNQGQVYVYRQLSFNNWTFVQQLSMPNSNYSFQIGTAIATESNAVYIGAPGNNTVQQFVYNGSQWFLGKSYQVSISNASFGAAITVLDGRKIIGAPTCTNSSNLPTGAVYVYAQDDTLTTVIFGNNGSMFGSALTGYGLLFAVGAPNDSTFGPDSGAVYLYQIVPSPPPSLLPTAIPSPQQPSNSTPLYSPVANSSTPNGLPPSTPIFTTTLSLPALLAGVIGGALALIIAIVLLIVLLRKRFKRRPNNFEPSKESSQMTQSVVDSIPFQEIKCQVVLGYGSFGRVVRAQWKSNTVAVRFCTGLRSLGEFKTAGSRLINLPPHPNIVQVYGISIDGPQPALVVEYCSGGALKNKNLQDQALRIVSKIVAGMLHLHRHNIVHGNLTARNILLTDNEEPKLADYGLHDFLVQRGPGPLRWMAPESIRSREFTIKSDVWMFGITVWEIVTNQEPYEQIDELRISSMIRDSGLRPDLPEQCPKVLKEIMESCWELDPRDRPTFEEIEAKLRRRSTAHRSGLTALRDSN